MIRILQCHIGTLGHAVKRVIGDMERNVDFVGETLVQSAQHGAATCQIDAILDDIRIELRRSGLQGGHDGLLQLAQGVLDTVGNLLVADLDFHGKRGDLVGTMHDVGLGSILLKVGDGAAHIEFDALTLMLC